MRRHSFAIGEYYHIYNHGVETRNIFDEPDDTDRFLQSMQFFNTIKPIGSLYEFSFEKKGAPSKSQWLVELIAYCLNPNHFHIIFKELRHGGISELMKRIGIGYTLYFNTKNKRKGALFRGRFKSKHISDNDYLLHTSAYVNLNNRVHQLGDPISKLVQSSWDEYVTGQKGRCGKSVILGQFTKPKDYEKFAFESLELSLERKQEDKEYKALMFD